MHVDVGEGSTPVLMLHGAGVSGWMWTPTRELLRPEVKALVPDLPGYGRSAGQPYVSHAATLQELVGVLEREAPHGAHVVGFSLGAQLALLLASEVPHLVKGVMVISAETKPAPLPGPTLALLSLAAPLSRLRWFATAQARELGIPAHLLNSYLHDSATVTRQTLLASVSENIRFKLPSTWSEYQGAAAVLVGAKERKLMHESAELTASARSAIRVRIIPEAAHDIPLRSPGIIATEIHGQIVGWNAP